MDKIFNVNVYFNNETTSYFLVKADSYKISYVEIYDGQEQVEAMELVRRYAQNLEAMIRRRPELWMWSHNRWRHTPEKQARRFGKKKEA